MYCYTFKSPKDKGLKTATAPNSCSCHKQLQLSRQVVATELAAGSAQRAPLPQFEPAVTEKSTNTYYNNNT